MFRIIEYIKKQIIEIQGDPVLRVYGGFITGCYLWTFRSWNREYVLEAMALAEKAHCWPFFENCFAFRPFTVDQMQIVIYAYGLMSLIGVVLFLMPKRATLAYLWLLLIVILKTLIYVQDYSLRMNQHYMLYFMTLVFMFLPHKRQLLRIALVMFYFWAGTLKMNMEWLSSEALPTKPWIVPWRFFVASCWYAMFLELVIVWGILSANKWFFWATLFQLYLFHIASFSVVGKFYPVLMFMLLMIFPMARLFPSRVESKSQLKDLVKGKQPMLIYAYIVLFSMLQLYPVMIPGDEKITGEGRIFALHMIDAHVKCEGEIELKFKDGQNEIIPIPTDFYIRRTICEPSLNYAVAKRMCYLNRDNPNFLDLDIKYQARRNHQDTMRPLVDIKNFCSRDISYDLLKPNDWIIKNGY